MRFGVYLLQYITSETENSLFNELVDQIRYLEKYGFHSAFMGERHLYQDGFLELLASMTALAVKSETIKIGSNVLLLPLYHPLHLAEWIATIDNISQGRIILGVGLGYRLEELTVFGIDSRERVARFEEGLMLMKRLWTEPSITFKGKFFNLSNALVYPKPLQTPYPMILIGGSSKPAIERAARLGDGFAAGGDPIDAIEKQVSIYREAIGKYGKDTGKNEIFLIRESSIAEKYDDAQKSIEPSLMKLYSLYERWRNPMIEEKTELNFDQMLREDRFIIGTPDECIEKVEKVHRLGVKELILRFQFPGIPQKRVLQNIRIWGEKVIPYFKEND